MLLIVSVKMVTVVLLVAAQNSNEGFKVQDKSKLLAKSLRRQLMHDNYDYSHEEINDTVKDNINKREHKKKTRKNFYVSDLAVEEKDGKSPFKDNENVKNDKKGLEHIVSKKDLLYYIDDENIATDKSVNIQSTAKYKFLKLRRQYRRSGQARLLQEEGKEGISIVNLDKGPFPELRLPNSRRQYMHDHGEAMTDEEEIPPPAINTSDPEAAADGIENLTETESANILTTNFN